MKRNCLPDSEELLSEQAIIDQRLKDLFSDEIHQVPINCKGQWLPESQHVKLESTRGIPPRLIKFQTYHYLDRFEALYCLECSKLVIFHDGVPLSLIEAYQILIDDFRLYSVYQQLMRSGHVCLRSGSGLEVKTTPDGFSNVVICDRSDGLPPQWITESDHKTFYALVDEDFSVCFVQFQDLNAETTT